MHFISLRPFCKCKMFYSKKVINQNVRNIKLHVMVIFDLCIRCYTMRIKLSGKKETD